MPSIVCAILHIAILDHIMFLSYIALVFDFYVRYPLSDLFCVISTSFKNMAVITPSVSCSSFLNKIGIKAVQKPHLAYMRFLFVISKIDMMDRLGKWCPRLLLRQTFYS